MENNELKELYKSSSFRYAKILELVKNLQLAIMDEGIEDIPSCAFCDVDMIKEQKSEYYERCSECEWGEKFGFCDDEHNSNWKQLRTLIDKVYEHIDKLLDDIEIEICKL